MEVDHDTLDWVQVVFFRLSTAVDVGLKGVSVVLEASDALCRLLE